MLHHSINFSFYYDDEEDPEIIVVSPSSREHSAVSTFTLPHSYGQAVFPTSSPIS